MTYQGVYRAKALRVQGGAITAYVPQVFGDTPITITNVIGGMPEPPAAGWVMFESGWAEFPVWTSGVVTGGGPYEPSPGNGQSVNEVWVDNEAPPDPNVELWFDPDAPTPPSGYLTREEADALFLTPAEGDALFLTPAEAAAMVTPAEVNVSLAGPSPRVGELLWVDTDEATGTYLRNEWGPGPWPQSYVVNVPYKADVLVVVSATCYSNALGMCGVKLQLDGVDWPRYADLYFNEASSHKTLMLVACYRGVSAGNHTWTLAPAFGSTLSDNNDRSHLAFTMVAVP